MPAGILPLSSRRRSPNSRPRRFARRLPRPLGIGVAAVVLVIAGSSSPLIAAEWLGWRRKFTSLR